MSSPRDQISARIVNDHFRAVTLLWHRPMAGGLNIAQDVATCAATSSPHFASSADAACPPTGLLAAPFWC
jgi:hypothetical protein